MNYSKIVLLTYTDFNGNNNKYYLLMHDPNANTGVRRWGRITDDISNIIEQTKNMVESGQTSGSLVVEKTSWYEYDEIISQKQKKGYKHVQLASSNTNNNTPFQITSENADVIKIIMGEARDTLTNYYGNLPNLERQQITLARSIIVESSSMIDIMMKDGWDKLSSTTQKRLIETAERFCGIIPHRLGAKIVPEKVAQSWCELVYTGVIEDKLLQLESQLLSTPNVDPNIMIGRFDSGVVSQITKYVKQTLNAKVAGVYSVCIKDERDRFNQEQVGKTRVLQLFHGTYSANVYHILQQGLIIPHYAANGSRLGRGIYTSDSASRSYNYTGASSSRVPRMMFVTDVALGKSYQTSGEDSSLTFENLSKRGYQSSHGTGSWSGKGDEFVVYKTSQATIRALILLD